jgi:uncharacterized membrane protein
MLGLDGTGWVEPVSLAVYSGIAAIALSQFKNCKQAFMISLGIQLVGLFLFAVFGKWMLAGLLVLVGLLGWTTKKF